MDNDILDFSPYNIYTSQYRILNVNWEPTDHRFSEIEQRDNRICIYIHTFVCVCVWTSNYIFVVVVVVFAQ